RHFRGVCNFADDLDDVPVRVEDAQLAIGAVAVAENLLDSFELAVRAELPGVRPDLLKSATNQLCNGDAVPPSGCEIHERRFEAVAAGKPLVLRGEDAVVRRDFFAAIELLGEELHEGLAVRDDRDDVLE